MFILSGPAGADSGWWRQLPNWVWEETGERTGHQGAPTHKAVQVDTDPSPPHTDLWAHTHAQIPLALCAHRYYKYLFHHLIYYY